MSASEHVKDARQWAEELTQTEMRGGTLEATWHRLEAMFSIPTQTFWALRYRPPKQIAADLYTKLRLARLQQCERVIRSAQHDIDILKATGRGDDLGNVEAKIIDIVEAINAAKKAS